MTKRLICFLLVLILSTVTVAAVATDSSTTLDTLNKNTNNEPSNGQSPTLSVALYNLNQVANTQPLMSPSLSMTLNNLNQVSGGGWSPSLSMTLGNLNQVSANTGLSPSLSMTLNTLTRFSSLKNYGVPLSGLFTIKEKLTEEAQAAFDAIAAYVGDGQAAFSYFGTNISNQVLKGYLSSAYLRLDLSQLILSEYVSLGINDYQPSNDGVSATFGFASEYSDGQPVLAMFGYRDAAGGVVWNALNTVAVDGQVKIDIPSELLLRAGSQAILGILS